METLIDTGHLLEMSQELGEALPPLLEELRAQANRRVMEEVPSQALFHDLKGALACLGLAAPAAQAAEHEKACKTQQKLPDSWQAEFLKLVDEALKQVAVSLEL